MLRIEVDQLYTDPETTQFLRLRPGTLKVWRSTGRYPLRARKVGGRILYKGSDIVAFIDGPHKPPRPHAPKNPARPKAKSSRAR